MALARHCVQACYEAACRREIEALKPGNVHVFADGHRMYADQFLASAKVSSGPLTEPASPVGRRILEAVRATRREIGTNTNLGIVLLCAPLASAAAMDEPDLRANLGKILDGLSIEDSSAAFEAIVLASPGGLGAADTNDVTAPAKVGLQEAMREASGRDRIARQYVTCFADVFETGTTALNRAISDGQTGMWPTILAYMAFLAGFPDSHIARRHGVPAALHVREEAVAVEAKFAAAGDEASRLGLLQEFDRSLKARAFNPGTSADLTVASLFAHMLRDHLA